MPLKLYIHNPLTLAKNTRANGYVRKSGVVVAFRTETPPPSQCHPDQRPS